MSANLISNNFPGSLSFGAQNSPPPGFSTETCFRWLEDLNAISGSNIRGEINYAYNLELSKMGLTSCLIPGGEDFEQLGADKTTPIVRPDLYFLTCKKINKKLNTFSKDLFFAGSIFSTADFFEFLGKQNEKYGINIRGLIHERYNFLIRHNSVFKAIPGGCLEVLGMDRQTSVKGDYFLRAYRDVIASFEKSLTYSHCGPLSIKEYPSHDFSTRESLEVALAPYCFLRVDSQNNRGFNFIEPNELSPRNLERHYDLAPAGVYVITGTERLFFALLFSNVNKCRGVIGRDISGQVIAYNNFNILLLRISPTREIYKELSSPKTDDEELGNRLRVIRKMTENSDLPSEAKTYYLNNLDDFGNIYLNSSKQWRKRNEFADCHYHLNDAQFLKLQAYAKAGLIIVTHGDINDLSFLKFIKKIKISVIDSSNIKDYVLLDFKGGKDNFHPRIVTTEEQADGDFTYSSYIHVPLTKNEDTEFSARYKTLYTAAPPYRRCELVKLFRDVREKNPYPFDANVGAIRSPKALCKLKKYIENNIIEVPDRAPINMQHEIGELYKLSSKQIEILSEQGKLTRHLSALVPRKFGIFPSGYPSEFKKIPGWSKAFNEVFEVHFSSKTNDLPEFLRDLEMSNCLKEFILDFGKERLGALVERYLSHGEDYLYNWNNCFEWRSYEELCSFLEV